LSEVHWHTFPIRICLLASVLFLIYLSARRAVGAWYFHQASPDAIQSALRWDPANPEYHDALGNFMHVYADGGNSFEIVELYRSATRLSPHDAQFWADLGDGYDWAGNSAGALDAFQHAQRLFPNSPEINWRLANFYVRAGKIPDALHTLRMVLLDDSTAARNVFTLATKATPDSEMILEMLPPRGPIFFDYLNFQIEKGDIAGAEQVWANVLHQNLPFDLREAYPYFDALIQHKELAHLSDAWSALVQRFPAQLRRLVTGPNLIANGNFEFDILNGGFDWRVVPTDGADVAVDPAGSFDGSRALRIRFDGSHNLDYVHVFEYVPVQANTRYRFSVHTRAQGITTNSGPRLQVCDAYDMEDLFVSTENLVGTSGWLEQLGEFTTRADTRMLLVRVARPASRMIDNRISGTVWFDGISLTAE
jgi:hypothetical protein